MAFDAGAVVGHVDLKTGDFVINANKVMSASGGMTKSMVGAQIQFALLEKAIQSVSNFLKGSVNKFIEQEKVEAQLAQTLKSTSYAAGLTSKELKDMATSMQGLTTYGDEAVISAENLLLTFTNIGKDVFPDALETVLDMSTALGQDLKSSSIQLGKALQDPILGVTALRRVGVNFNEAQAETIKNMVKVGKTAEAQAYILKELKTEFGGSAKAARDTFGGSLKALENNLGDMQEKIGAAIIPILHDMTKAIMPVVDFVKGLDKSTIQLALGFGAAIVAIFGAVKAFQKLSAAFSAGISPLQGVLLAVAAIGTAIAIANQAFLESKVIHQKLAEQYEKEYDAIDGQVQRYKELKNAQTLTGAQKAELAKVEDDLQKQLGETSLFLDQQSGKWTVNANAVQNYKKERLDLMIRELKAQEIVAKADVQWAKEREAWFKRGEAEMKRFGMKSTETTLQWIRYGLDVISIDKARLFTIQEVGKTQDDLANTQGQLNALQKDGVTGLKQYRSETEKNNSELKGMAGNVKTLTGAEEERQKKLEAMRELQKDLLGETLEGHEQEIFELQRKREMYEKEYGKQAFITEWYNKRMAEINKKYAEDAKRAWADAIEDIVSTIEDIISPVQQAWGAISGVWQQALKNEEIAMENEYTKRKERIENSVKDEDEKTKQLEALDKEYADKRAELQKKQWVAQQAGAITTAIMNTAQGVTSALAVFPPWLGIALAATVGALGAAQVALIASQPMPEFAAGGMASPGLALVGERGPELVNFDRSARVYNNADTEKILSAGMTMNNNFYGDMRTDIDMSRLLQLSGARYRSTLRFAS